MVSLFRLTYLMQLYYLGKLSNLENHESNPKLLIFPMLQMTMLGR